MFKKILATTIFLSCIVTSACWFTATNFNKNYIARINNAVTMYSDAVWTGNNIPCPPPGKQNIPAQVWVKLQPRGEVGAPVVSEAILQYKKLPNGTWITFKRLYSLNWNIDFTKPVQLFGPNTFDPPGAVENDAYLIRLWFSDGLYENADINENAPEGGDSIWRNQWVTKVIIGKRRPI
jgi:hypothetical protein